MKCYKSACKSLIFSQYTHTFVKAAFIWTFFLLILFLLVGVIACGHCVCVIFLRMRNRGNGRKWRWKQNSKSAMSKCPLVIFVFFSFFLSMLAIMRLLQSYTYGMRVHAHTLYMRTYSFQSTNDSENGKL